MIFLTTKQIDRSNWLILRTKRQNSLHDGSRVNATIYVVIIDRSYHFKLVIYKSGCGPFEPPSVHNRNFDRLEIIGSRLQHRQVTMLPLVKAGDWVTNFPVF